jgi:hypothetical protein
MRVIGRCISYGPLNTSRITSAAGTIERTIMDMTTAIEAMSMVVDTTTIDTTITSGTTIMIGTTTASETIFALAV